MLTIRGKHKNCFGCFLAISGLLSLKPALGQLLDDYCLGYSQVFGEEGKQVMDDAIHAILFAEMME